MLSWRSDVKNGQNIIAAKVGSSGMTKNTWQFAMDVHALIIVGMTANSSGRLATALEQINADGNSYKA